MIVIELLKLLYELQPVRTTMIKSCEKIPMINEQLHKGSQLPIPRFFARILEKNGLAEISENVLLQQDLARTRFSHMQQKGSLLKIDDFFYSKARENIKFVTTKAKLESDIAVLRISEKMREDFIDIVNTRMSIVFRALQLGGIDLIEKNCTIEEKTLIELIHSIYSKWLKEFVEIGSG